MKGFGGCLLVFGGLLGLYLAITLSFTFFLLPIAFVLLVGCLILISYALGPSDQE